MQTILFADNNPDFLDTCAEYLKPEYRVIKAYSLDEAKECLATRNVHLAILDVRLVDDDDEKDVSGLMLAKEPAYRSLPKIILTKWPSVDGVRDALAPVLEGMPPAVGYVSKRELPDGLLRAVEKAFREYVCINWGLPIRFAEPARLSWAHLAAVVEPEYDPLLLSCRAAEMEDLLRKLFREYAQITLGSLLWSRPGRVGVTIWAYGELGATGAYAVIIGPPPEVAEETSRFQRWAPSGTAGKLSISLESTLHYQAAAYPLPEAEWGEVRSFANYYASETLEEVRAAIDGLARRHLAAWASEARGVLQDDTHTLPALCCKLALASQTLTPESLQDLARRAVSLPGGTLAVTAETVDWRPALGRAASYPHPLAALDRIAAKSSALPITCPAPSRLSGENILVGDDGRTWLTDLDTGLAPRLWAFACLEATLRYDLLHTVELRALHDLEKRLLQPQSLGDHLDVRDVDLPLRKALSAIQQVRHCACELTADDPEAYHICLLYLALDRLAMYQPGVRYGRHEYARFAHALLSAAMICQQLLSIQEGFVPRKGVVIDVANRRVRVEGREITLSGAEFDVLVYLYKHAGQLCTRRAIVEEALQETCSDAQQDAGRLNTLMSRLRGKLEPDPDHPRYVVTVRGEGYRFVTEDNDSA